MKAKLCHWWQAGEGFTLLELIIVLVILSTLALVAAPRLSVFLSGRRGNFVVLSSIIQKTFDDSFINNRVNYLVVHLGEGGDGMSSYNESVFSRANGVSVVTMAGDGKLAETPNRLLSYRRFPSSFRIEKALLSSGEKATSGGVLIPFYPQGYADNAVLHILVDDDRRYSIIIRKFSRTAEIVEDFADFDATGIPR